MTEIEDLRVGLEILEDLLNKQCGKGMMIITPAGALERLLAGEESGVEIVGPDYARMKDLYDMILVAQHNLKIAEETND